MSGLCACQWRFARLHVAANAPLPRAVSARLHQFNRSRVSGLCKQACLPALAIRSHVCRMCVTLVHAAAGTHFPVAVGARRLLTSSPHMHGPRTAVHPTALTTLPYVCQSCLMASGHHLLGRQGNRSPGTIKASRKLTIWHGCPPQHHATSATRITFTLALTFRGLAMRRAAGKILLIRRLPHIVSHGVNLPLCAVRRDIAPVSHCLLASLLERRRVRCVMI
ncbi:hypothetical protein WS48_04385 [Burkholderia sp. RF7-non_BP1]|nr:hypothetical protein WS46_16720 [Burkholderia sp. RF4-BP95]KUY96700.1 hypothetical protein WS49_22605 [Burkholderia sp. RF7-non_BP4]KUZ02915.1 hypothetical protein WS48_04385 [Burkholderia sp. RF7-non_BP1]